MNPRERKKNPYSYRPRSQSRSSLAQKWAKKIGLKGIKKVLSKSGVTDINSLLGYLGLGDSGWSGVTGALMASGPEASLAAETALAAAVEGGLSTSLMGPGGSALGQGLADLGVGASVSGGGTAAGGAGASAGGMGALAGGAVAIGVPLGIAMAMGMPDPFTAMLTRSSHNPQSAASVIDANMRYLERAKAAEQKYGKGRLGFGADAIDPTREVLYQMNQLAPLAGQRYKQYGDEAVRAFISALGYEPVTEKPKLPLDPGTIYG